MITRATKQRYESKQTHTQSVADSGYEINFMIYLDKLMQEKKIKYWLKNTTKMAFSQEISYKSNKGITTQKGYIPDFIVFYNDGTYKIIEIKGWLDSAKNKAILAQCKKDFKGLNFEILTKSDIKKIQNELKKELNGALPFGWVKVA